MKLTNLKIPLHLHRPNLRQVVTFIKQRPLTSFFISLGLLLALIILGSLVFRPKLRETKKEPVVKEVQVYSFGSTPTSTFQAQIEKKGVIKIQSQIGAVVQSINVREGMQVNKGANLITLSTNYQGSNAPAVQTSIASKQLELATETLNAQKEIIAKQRDVANQTLTNAEKQRDIANRSVEETQSLIDLNQQMLDAINKNLSDLQSANASSSAILAIQQSKAQLLSGLNQARSSFRNLQLQTDINSPPAKLAELQRDITLKQLDLQEKTLQINKDIAALQVSLATINEALLHPTAPFTGTIERIYIRPGQLVNPGTPLLLLANYNHEINAVAKVPANVSSSVSASIPSTLRFENSQTVKSVPYFISNEASDGQLYAIIYKIPSEFSDQVTDNEYILVDIPLGLLGEAFIPLDAVYQTQNEAFVYIAKEGKAVTKKVVLGTVQGQFVTVSSGLSVSDQVILNRNVIEGDTVKTVAK